MKNNEAPRAKARGLLERILKPQPKAGRMYQRIATAVFAVLCVIFLLNGIAKGDNPAPDFKLRDLREENITLSDYRGKNSVILFFWTTWCPFCRKEIKGLNDRYSRFAGDGVKLFAINIGEEAHKVGKFTRSFSLLYPVLLDEEADVARLYGIQGIPTYIFINQQGEIVYRGHYFPEPQYRTLSGDK